MPELPEVEVTRRGLLPHLLGQKVVTASWSGKPMRQPVPWQLLQDWICGNGIIALDRRAKYLLMRMKDRSVLVLHLGMTGKLGIFPQTQAIMRHDHLCLRLDNTLELRLNDARRFGSIAVWPGEQSVALEGKFNQQQGIEPLGPDFIPAKLRALAQERRQAIKTLLMNSHLISGIGNIYANEILFAAGIHPQTSAKSLTKH
ncbi:MAG: formamidopyrimidine-DNA glycosylase, partial [Candidatus Electrothrix sp. AR3]|nr:formamidopyrimidine-DNA glycosylase [Candidatus Electrothrix sp. AR3]